MLVALLVPEKYTDAVGKWIQAQGIEPLVVSLWARTEVGSALAMKRWLGRLNDAGHAAAARSVRLLFESVPTVEVRDDHFFAAGERFVSAPPSGLRAGDALHLAIVVDHGFGLATLDRKFAEAARNIGVAVEAIDGG